MCADEESSVRDALASQLAPLLQEILPRARPPESAQVFMSDIIQACKMDTYVQLANVITEPHAHDISADIVRVWLSDCVLQHIHTYV